MLKWPTYIVLGLSMLAFALASTPTMVGMMEWGVGTILMFVLVGLSYSEGLHDGLRRRAHKEGRQGRLK